MAKLKEVYKCAICGNIIEVLHGGAGTLVCCGQPMDLLVEKKEDTGAEKHVPVIEKTDSGFLVKVGPVPHPMEEAHFIEWIEVETEKAIFKKFLNPGEPAEIQVCHEPKSARAYCNVHGLWQS